MKRAVLMLPIVAVLAVMGWTGAQGRTGEASLCEGMTPARLLENPGLAHDYAQALRSGEPSEVERVKALFESIRAAHGCDGEVALPSTLPDDARALPPGHPPIDGPSRDSGSELFQPPSTLSI